MNRPLYLLGLSGSLRIQSRNTGLLRCARAALTCEAHQNVRMDIADLADIPLYNADMKNKPQAVITLAEQAAKADAFVLACPEYNYSLAPVLKNALDWLSLEPDAPLSGKTAALLGAGGSSGTIRAQYHLRQVCVYLNLYLLNKPEIFLNAFGSEFDADGNVTDRTTTERVAEQMRALILLTRQRHA